MILYKPRPQEWLKKSHEHFLKVAPSYNRGRTFEQGKFWADEINQRISLLPADTLLDAGCGTGLFSLEFSQHLASQIVGLDPSRKMLEQARLYDTQKDVDWCQGEAEELPFDSGSLKVIFLSQVWHHLINDVRAAEQFYRTLETQGALFIKTFSHAQLLQRWDITVIFPELLQFMLDIYPDIADFEAILGNCGFLVQHNSYQKEAYMRPSELLDVASNRLWSMFSFISEEGLERGLECLRKLQQEGDVPVRYDEYHLLVHATKP